MLKDNVHYQFYDNVMTYHQNLFLFLDLCIATENLLKKENLNSTYLIRVLSNKEDL